MMAHSIQTSDVTHPYIQDAYVRKNKSGQDLRTSDVLVLETTCKAERRKSLNSKYADVLTDLDEIVQTLENRGEHVDYIDIRLK